MVRTCGFIPSGLKNLQELRLLSISGQPVPVLDRPRGVKGFLYAQSEPPMFQFMSVVSRSTALQQLPLCQNPRAFPAELHLSLVPRQKVLPSQVQHLAFVLVEFPKVSVAHSCSLFRSIWTAALPFCIPAAPYNLVPSAALLSTHSIASPSSQVHPICFFQLLQRRRPFSSEWQWCSWHCPSYPPCLGAGVCPRDEFSRVELT